MVTSFNDLPQELCNRIVRFIGDDHKTLLRLCLTSVRFINEAQSHLYTHLTFLDPRKSSKLLSTLTIHNPSLAKYVKAFEYNIELQKDDPAYEDLHSALRLLINVTWLEINTPIPHSPQGFFRGCTFQLKHFRCNFSFSDRTAIYKMLSTQPSLQSVYIDKFDHDFPSDCCLNINSLFVEDWRSVVQILPGRSIKVLELLQVEPFFDSVPPSITTHLGNLTHLTFQTDTPYDFLESVAPYLTRLMILRIIGKDEVTPSRMSIAEEPEVLCKLTNLEVFVWSLKIDFDPEVELDLSDIQYYQHTILWDPVKVWFEGMPKLEAVYTLDQCSWGLLWADYFCWTKNMHSRRVEAEVALGRESFYTW